MNVASGDYSTTIGKRNTTRGNCSFTGGYQNLSYGEYSLMFGLANSSQDHAARNIVLGHYNTLTGGVQENYMLGSGLSSNRNYLAIIGSHNAAPVIVNPRVILAAGHNNSTKRNAIEVGTTSAKILVNLQLAADTTEVNAITPPQDPNNVTTDDQTLVTLGHMNAGFSKSQVAYFSEYDTALSVPLDTTSIDFTTSFGAPPAWANRAFITFRWENELIQKEIHFTKNEGIHLNIVQRAYSTFPETVVHKHLRLEWDFTAKTLTAADYWTYDQDMSNSGAISNWDHTLTNASACKVLSVVYSQ